MNTHVSFETARLLKQKGFEERVKSYTQDGKLVNVSLSIRRLNPEKVYYPAPTVADVVMWIYEKHNIWISIDRYMDPEESEDFRYGYMIYYIDDYFGRGHKTPTEAYEAAIEYTLNKLI